MPDQKHNAQHDEPTQALSQSDLLAIVAGDTQLEHIRIARYNVNTALKSLTDDYNRWDEVGKKLAVNSAVRELEWAWKRLNVIISANH